MFTYRKPKNYQEAYYLAASLKNIPPWGIYTEESFFEYNPILYIYKDGLLVGASHNRNGIVKIFDVNNRNVTKTYNKLVLNEIVELLNQVEFI